MKIYLAPMEGITGEVYRRAYHTFFEPMDKYFTPFLNPNPKGKFSRQEWNEILPENNEGMYTVPQILTNRAEDFIRLARQLKEFGYEEVNLNLGCPSKTVVNRKRGSGFLFYPDELNHFLAEVFDQLDMKISIKTRSGKYDQEEFEELLDIYNQYPLEELILHPRVQQDYYKNKPDWTTFAYACRNSKNPLVYKHSTFPNASPCGRHFLCGRLQNFPGEISRSRMHHARKRNSDEPISSGSYKREIYI